MPTESNFAFRHSVADRSPAASRIAAADVATTRATVRLASAAVLTLAVFGAFPATASALEVVVTSKPIHSLVAGVMGETGKPKLLVDGSASPHTYAMKPSDAKAVNAAKVFFRVSEGLEPFTGKLVKSLPKSVTVVSLEEAPGVTRLDRRKGRTFETHSHGSGKKGHDRHGHHDDHDDDDHADGSRTDPHVWLDPSNAATMTRHIAEALAKADAANASVYRANAEGVATRIDALATEISREIAPVKGRPFVVFHDAYQYFERRFETPAAGSITVSPEVQPSAKRLAAIRRKIVELGAVCVFAEPQFKSKLIDTVVEGTKSRAGTLDPEGSQIEAGPDLYFALMRGLSRNLVSCLAPST